jgi:hypothetical protein
MLFQSTSTSSKTECGFCHTHTILVISCPSAALASVRSECPHHCRLHETPGGWSLGPVQTLPLSIRVHFPSQAHPSRELGTTCVFELASDVKAFQFCQVSRNLTRVRVQCLLNHLPTLCLKRQMRGCLDVDLDKPNPHLRDHHWKRLSRGSPRRDNISLRTPGKVPAIFIGSMPSRRCCRIHR